MINTLMQNENKFITKSIIYNQKSISKSPIELPWKPPALEEMNTCTSTHSSLEFTKFWFGRDYAGGILQRGSSPHSL